MQQVQNKWIDTIFSAQLFRHIPNPAVLEVGCSHNSLLVTLPVLEMGTTKEKALPIPFHSKSTGA